MQNVTDAPAKRRRRLKADAPLRLVDGMGVHPAIAELPLRLLKLAAAAGVELVMDYDDLPASTGGGVYIGRSREWLDGEFGPVIIIGLRVIAELSTDSPEGVLAHEVAHALDPMFGPAREDFANTLGPMLLRRRVSSLRGVRPLVVETVEAVYGAPWKGGRRTTQ